MAQHSTTPSPRTTPRIAVIGTGFAGLCMGIKLKQAGIESFTIFEQAPELGGTWRDNDYPGCACDVQSHVYSYSFEPNPKWSRMFAPQKEIRAYTEHCAQKYGLLPHIRLSCKVVSARFDEASATWELTLGSGERVTVDMICSATGFLNRPQVPQIPGLDKFEGKIFHSAKWDHSYDLEGKTVAVIGTGASAIQFVPQIAPKVKQLHLMQRTPPWVIPKPDRATSAFEQGVLSVSPLSLRLFRLALYWWNELRVLGFVIDPKIMKFPQRAAGRYLARTIPDPVLRAKLKPNYTIGCKRVLFSNDYYPTLKRSNVEVVTDGIAEITRDSIVTRDGVARKIDTLILGTGFLSADAWAPFEIQGRGGLRLDDAWREGAEAYFGTTIAHFPNYFMIVGPNTGLGHSSMIFMIESQVAHVMHCIDAMRRHGARWIEMRQDAQQRFNRQLQERLGRTVWATGCGSWYLNKNGKNTTLWPGFTFAFRLATRRLREQDYVFASGLGSRDHAAGAAAHAAAE